MALEIVNLHASVDGKKILNGINLTIGDGEVHALMGPNGSGKSTLANVIMGNPSFTVESGIVWYKGINILELPIHERARLGLYLAFQYPAEIGGITVGRFLKQAAEVRLSEGENLKVSQFIGDLRSAMEYMEMDQDFINRYLNAGFSGGEKKRLEVLQMLMLKPGCAILDETDSGLDIDALKIVSKGVNKMRDGNFSSLIITHYQRILNYITPDYVHVMYRGEIAQSGGPELVTALEEKGYDWVKKEEDHEQLIANY